MEYYAILCVLKDFFTLMKLRNYSHVYLRLRIATLGEVVSQY